MRIEARVFTSRLKHGLVLHHSRLEGQRLLPVVMCSTKAASGFGEAPPLPTFTGESAEDTVRNIQFVAHTLSGQSPTDALDTLHNVSHKVSSQTRAALDIALHDLLAKESDQPLCKLLGATLLKPIRVSRAIGFHTLE